MINRLVKPIRLRMRHQKKRLIPWAERWRWVLITGVGVPLFLAEVYEFTELMPLNPSLHFGEIVLFVILLAGTGLFLELFVRLNRDYKHMLKILGYKHNLSLELALNDSWETFTAKLAELPHRIAAVDEAYLLASNPFSGKFETTSHWIDVTLVPGTETWDPAVQCQKCFAKASSKKTSFHLCSNGIETSSYHVYSLEMIYPNMATAVLKFRLKPGSILSYEEEQIFKNIGDEIAVALRVSQDRKRLSEMQHAEVTMAERRTMSAYVHDELGQNLGYLHLKLSQLSSNHYDNTPVDIQTEIKRLEGVANESYLLVRDILKKLQPETSPHLTNLLREHAKIVSQRANFVLDFNCIGGPIPLASDVQQAIFYIFREILSNIEKHARADKVEALVLWREDFLDISVADNGVGFDQNLVHRDEHFGLEIMQERIFNLDGQIAIKSSADTGTVVSLSIPLNFRNN